MVNVWSSSLFVYSEFFTVLIIFQPMIYQLIDCPYRLLLQLTLSAIGKTAITTPKSNDTDLKKIDFS